MRFPAFGHCAAHTLHSCMPHFQFDAPYVWEHFGASLSSYCRFVSTQVHEKLKWSSIHTSLFVWICIGCTVWLALCQVKPSLSGHRRIVGSFVLAGRLESQGETMVTWHDTDVICRENATHGSSWLWIPVPTLLGVEGLLCYLLPAGIYWCQAPFLEQPAEELLDLAETLLICCCCYCMSLDHARSIFLDFFNCFSVELHNVPTTDRERRDTFIQQVLSCAIDMSCSLFTWQGCSRHQPFTTVAKGRPTRGQKLLSIEITSYSPLRSL